MREKIYGAAEKEAAAMQSAAKQAQKEEDQRAAAAARLNQGLERQIELQQLVNEDKQKEAFVLRNRLQMEDALGRALTEAEAAENERLAATLYDLQHPAAPSPEPEPAASGSSNRAVRPRVGGRIASSSVAHLDRLQRIGANVSTAAVSPEKVVLDEQLKVQEMMSAKMDALIQNGYKMRF